MSQEELVTMTVGYEERETVEAEELNGLSVINIDLQCDAGFLFGDADDLERS